MSENANTTRADDDGLFEMGVRLVTRVVHTGLNVVSSPLSILPPNTRVRVRRGIAELARGVIALPKELADISERVVDDIFSGTPPTLPSTETISNRARAFTERLARAANELGTSVGQVAGRAVDGGERSAAKVDEWVEKAPKTP
ncbi:MAG: hypothetical protein WCG26_16385 [Chloroflexales bacterium]